MIVPSQETCYVSKVAIFYSTLSLIILGQL